MVAAAGWLVPIGGGRPYWPGPDGRTAMDEPDELDERRAPDELTRLALAAGRGDRRALATFVARTQSEVWRFCAHLGSRGTADDLTQETYLRALPALERFEARASARTWLLAIARHTCADAVRREQRRRRLWRRATARHEAEAGAAGDGGQGGVELLQLLEALGPDRRAAFVATQVLGLSYAEAAEVCGCPVGTIRSRVARARQELVSWFEGAEEGAQAAGEPSRRPPPGPGGGAS